MALPLDGAAALTSITGGARADDVILKRCGGPCCVVDSLSTQKGIVGRREPTKPLIWIKNG